MSTDLILAGYKRLDSYELKDHVEREEDREKIRKAMGFAKV